MFLLSSQHADFLAGSHVIEPDYLVLEVGGQNSAVRGSKERDTGAAVTVEPLPFLAACEIPEPDLLFKVCRNKGLAVRR